VASYLITSPDGHFLLDTGVQSMTATIKNSVEALGFQMQDIKILLYFHSMNAKKVKV
jgi:metallo-beta-lactamase class B